MYILYIYIFLYIYIYIYIYIYAEWSKTQINFLDLTVYLESGNIKTDLYAFFFMSPLSL